MKLIDKNVSDLVSGYDALLKAENEIRSKWRLQLLAAYTRRMEVFERGNEPAKSAHVLVWISLLFGLILFLIGGGISCRWIVQTEENFLWYCCVGPLLSLLGLLMMGAAGFSRRNKSTPKPKRVPLHPLRSGNQLRGIYPNIKDSWLESLNGELENEIPDYPDYRDPSEKDHGAEGARIFIQQLRDVFDERYYVIAHAMQRPKEDVDVILIGPKGIWVFEIKHWSGKIFWDDQGWRREQTYFGRGGVEITKQPEIGEPPDEQWTRAAAEVSLTLQRRAPDILERYPALEKVHGGIVFTKKDAVFKFQPGRPTFWGPLNFWIKTLHDLEPKVELDRRCTLQLIEALLTRHHELVSTVEQRSMVTYTQGVIQDTDEKLLAWVKA